MRDKPAALLFDFFRARHGTATLPAAASAPTPFLLADPYLLVSAVQKAIRRGELELSRRAAHQLHGMDRQRLWRRLAVTALEDIGIGNMEVAAQVIALALIPAARGLFKDELAALDAALAIACGAVKDRTADHFCSIAEREPATPEERALLDQASPNALRAVVASAGQPWVRRLRAAVMVSGRVEKSSHLPDNMEALFDLYREMGVPDLLVAACTLYAARQRDPLAVFVPLAWLLHSPGYAGSVVTHSLSDGELAGDVPAYAFDPVNTRLGRHAVELFLRTHIMKPPYPPRMAAAAIWNSESALCDRTLHWTPGEEIRRRAYSADLTCRGLPVEQHTALHAWIAAERPALISARQTVWDSAVREAGKPAEVLKQANLPLPVPEGWSRRD